MNKELITLSSEDFRAYMVEKYPRLFREISLPPSQTCMCWGFDIGQGWRPILDELCQKLLVLEKVLDVEVIFTQIKEKFGEACFYHSIVVKNDDDLIYTIVSDIIDYHERRCAYYDDVTGDNCDPLDKIIISGWYYGCTAKGYYTALLDKYDKGVSNTDTPVEHTKKWFEDAKARLLMGKTQLGEQITEEDLT